MRRSKKTLPAQRVRELKREAQRIDSDEADAIKQQGRAIKARHDQLRNVARILKTERERLGISLTDVAARSGIAKANLSRLENDPHPNPTVDTLVRYAQALGCRLDIRLEPDSSAAA
jgi:DNA-binding Xre family transcriptional regulator